MQMDSGAQGDRYDVQAHDSDIIELTGHFLEHVYVTPARLAARRPKPAPAQPTHS
jgi:hypothetical protein